MGHTTLTLVEIHQRSGRGARHRHAGVHDRVEVTTGEPRKRLARHSPEPHNA